MGYIVNRNLHYEESVWVLSPAYFELNFHYNTFSSKISKCSFNEDVNISRNGDVKKKEFKMEFIENVPLSGQLDILLQAKEEGWAMDLPVPDQFHQIHRTNLENIMMAGTSGIPEYTQFSPESIAKNNVVIANSLKLLENSKLTGWLYLYTYILLINDMFYIQSEDRSCDFGLSGQPPKKLSDREVKEIESKFGKRCRYGPSIQDLLPDHYLIDYYPYMHLVKIDSVILLPFVGNPIPIATFDDLNEGFINQVFPIGYSLLRSNYYDGLYSESLEFFNHDVEHVIEFSETAMYNDEYHQLLNDLYHSCLNESDFGKYIIFLLIHERYIRKDANFKNLRDISRYLISEAIDSVSNQTLQRYLNRIPHLKRLKDQAYTNNYLDMIDQLNEFGMDTDYVDESGLHNLETAVDFATQKLLELNEKCGIVDRIFQYIS